MYELTNVETLGQDYTVTDTDGKVLKKIQIIPESEILDAALGEYDPFFESIEEYLTKSIALMTGFEEIDPTRVLWYATPDEEVELAEILEYAIRNGYDRIILEYIDYYLE